MRCREWVGAGFDRSCDRWVRRILKNGIGETEGQTFNKAVLGLARISL